MQTFAEKFISSKTVAIRSPFGTPGVFESENSIFYPTSFRFVAHDSDSMSFVFVGRLFIQVATAPPVLAPHGPTHTYRHRYASVEGLYDIGDECRAIAAGHEVY